MRRRAGAVAAGLVKKHNEGPEGYRSTEQHLWDRQVVSQKTSVGVWGSGRVRREEQGPKFFVVWQSWPGASEMQSIRSMTRDRADTFKANLLDALGDDEERRKHFKVWLEWDPDSEPEVLGQKLKSKKVQ